MNSVRRNQLIGFIVLLLFLLCIIPYVITDKSKLNEPSVSLLPSNDDVDLQDIDYTEGLERTEMSDSEGNDDSGTSSIHQNEIETTIGDESGNRQQMDKHYIVQLVALKNRQKIEELVALLRLNNYDVYTDPKTPQEGSSTRLLVGHYPSKEQAEIVIIDLQNLTKLKGIVVTK